MIPLAGLTLNELAAVIANHLKSDGIETVVIGGSAITAHAAQVYTSRDIDFATPGGESVRRITASLARIGFARHGRIYAHPDTAYTLDFIADTPYIDQRPIVEYAELSTPFGSFKVYRVEDAIADRVGHYVHWSDNEALEVAERVASACKEQIAEPALENALNQLPFPMRAAACG